MKIKEYRVAIIVGAIALILIVTAMIFPETDRGVRIPFNQAAAAGTLRTLGVAQQEFRKVSDRNSFACRFSELQSLGSEAPFGPSSSLYVDSAHAGYVFAITNCYRDSVGFHYQMTAIPSIPSKTGNDAYCTDETEAIWYDESGDAAKCLANRKLLWLSQEPR